MAEAQVLCTTPRILAKDTYPIRDLQVDQESGSTVGS